MPELPEVEIIKRILEKELIGQKLKQIRIFDQSYLLKNGLNNLTTLLGARLNSIERKGKYLMFFFEKELVLFHLGLTGFFILFKKNTKDFLDKNSKHLILIFEFEKNNLSYFDVRKFGKIKKARIEEISNIKELKELGKDALEVNFDEFKNIILEKKRNVRNLLMDQKILSGLGNIYVNELLFRAQISPFKNTKDLLEKDIERLFYHMKSLLKEAINLRGTSIKNYVDSTGKKGEFQQKLLVYGKSGLPCPYCGSTLMYQKMGQRGITFCLKCQTA